MFETLKTRLGMEKKPSDAAQKSIALACHRLSDLPQEKALAERMLAVCLGSQLVLTKTAEPPNRLNPNEICWVLPAGDVPLTVSLLMGNDEIETDLRIAFDPDHALAQFLRGRKTIEKTDLAALLARQWRDLAALEQVAAATLLNNADALSRFRTHLSLLLQEFGLRCVGIDRIEIVRTVETMDTEEIIEAELVAPNRENRYWDPTLIRLRLSNEDAMSLPVNIASPNTEPSTAVKLPKTTRSPRTWFMFRQSKIDEKLQYYLQTAAGEMITLLDLIQTRQNGIAEKARWNEARKTVLRIQDHLKTMPTLVPKQKNLRRKQRNIKELVQIVRRSATSAQLALGLLKTFAATDKSEKNIDSDLAWTLHLLENEIGNRKNIYQ